MLNAQYEDKINEWIRRKKVEVMLPYAHSVWLTVLIIIIIIARIILLIIIKYIILINWGHVIVDNNLWILVDCNVLFRNVSIES